MVTKLKLARIQRGLSQNDLARESGQTRWTVQALEGGLRSPTLDESAALAKVLGVRPHKIFPKQTLDQADGQGDIGGTHS